MFIFERKPKSIFAEAYRTLRNNIKYSSFDKEPKTILVTSSNSQEGKSTVCGNLALAFAQNDRKVLLIDCDFRTPALHKMFKVSNVCGFSDVLLGKRKIDTAIKNYDKKIDVLPAGSIVSNPSELLESEALDNTLELLKEYYDVIILDSSPVRIVSEPQLLATKVDGTILVAKKNKTKIEHVKESKELLNKVGANLIGVVLNYNEKARRKHKKYFDNKEIATN